MRLGTKSCSECRRRKVRCIFRGEAKQCASCQLHDTACQPQVPTAMTEHPPHSDLEARLSTLESLFFRLCKAAGLESGPGAGTNDIDILGLILIDRLQISRNSCSADQKVPSDAELDDGLGRSLEVHTFPEGLGSDTDLKTQHVLEFHKSNIRKWLPSAADMSWILESTHQYWALWPLHPSQLSPSKTLSVSVVSIASSFMDESLKSAEPTIVARALAWFALCVQQVPKVTTHRLSAALPSPAELISTYVDTAKSLLDLSCTSGHLLVRLLCHVLQARCYVNMGRPRMAWQSIRNAVDQGTLSGLHDERNHTDIERVKIWATILGYDRQLSLIIGVPYAISEAHLPNPSLGTPVEAVIMHNISLLSGRIIDRNQCHNTLSYAATLKLDEEAENLRDMIPSEWWIMNAGDRLALETFHTRQVSKMYYFQLKMQIHLPYMLRAATDKKYEYSRVSVLEAVKGTIYCYKERQRHPEGANVMCFLVDFLAFSAGIILITDLLSDRQLSTPEAKPEDWTLISGLICELKHVSHTLNHPVARQSVQILSYLFSAFNGTYQGPDIYEAIVPYFGRVCIRRPQPQTQNNSPNTVSLESNVFNFCSIPDITEAELDIDWTSLLDDTITFDWNGTFEF
ncbi:hypothetical protein BKA67DRAFT_513461 [Truncatella angustata]|uniref:Zn(2)-C6 fungal-type domain-containing protein n=1 Tax=Truncatella angustata TaxID=152316 RepID=A0A9P9A399_9PEZI|nr:uncharacterized protein BKA67DRAFT_513461 [Truncatella angustata]KAH6658715.1 hypothetical protein BKA67DRAFT_513461 [Truncatella angustata]